MTEAQHEKAYAKLIRKLELTEQSSDDVARLEDALEEAEGRSSSTSAGTR